MGSSAEDEKCVTTILHESVEYYGKNSRKYTGLGECELPVGSLTVTRAVFCMAG